MFNICVCIDFLIKVNDALIQYIYKSLLLHP